MQPCETAAPAPLRGPEHEEAGIPPGASRATLCAAPDGREVRWREAFGAGLHGPYPVWLTPDGRDGAGPPGYASEEAAEEPKVEPEDEPEGE